MADENGEIVKMQLEKRPFKICNSSREEKKGVACSSFEELKNISRERFMLGPDCRVFLESDGTEVDSDEYFQFLPPQTLFMVTQSSEKWAKSTEHVSYAGRKFDNESESQESYHALDETDARITLSVSLKQRIREEPLFFLSLSTDELFEIKNLDVEILQQELTCSEQYAQLILDNCEQELNRRTDIKQTHELLSVCHKAINRINQDSADSDEPKSKKLKL